MTVLQHPRQEPVSSAAGFDSAAVPSTSASEPTGARQPFAATEPVSSTYTTSSVSAASSLSAGDGLFGSANVTYLTSAQSYTFSDSAYASSSSVSASHLSSASQTSAYEWTASSSYSAQNSKWTGTSGSSGPVKGVAGQLVDLTLGGDIEGVSIYSVPVRVGHSTQAKGKRRALDYSTSPNGSRIESFAATGLTYSTYQLQVDLGSSDMWVVSPDCNTPSCPSKVSNFDSSGSISSGERATFNYAVGQVSGEIIWDEVSIGGFDVGYQAFVSADNVLNEDLGGGGFSGILGLALPANSVISQIIPGTTTSDPDGAIFLDNLFGLGPGAPDRRLFSLSLERREDVRTKSVLGIGAIDPTLCPDPCKPTNLTLVANPQLGPSGFLHWRIPLDGLTAVKYGNPEQGIDPQETAIPLPASKVVSGKSSPIVVLDSGGDSILVGDLNLLNSIYAPFKVTRAADGIYYVPCNSPISLTFTFAGKKYPMHPLDASWIGSDGTTTNCVGALQYQSALTQGDMVLGSSFLKNVYTIFNYPDPSNGRRWSPTVAMISLTNATVASQDFYQVRSLRLPLSDVSSSSGPLNPGSNATGVPPSSAKDVATGKHVLSSGLIALFSILGFLAFAASMFCGWFFWYRRKYGKGGVVTYGTASNRPRNRGHSSDISMSSLRSSSKKAENMQRQRSMVDGYSDFEGDSWMGSENQSQTHEADNHLAALGYVGDTDDELERVESRRMSDRSTKSHVPSGHRRDLSLDTSGEFDMPLADSPDVTLASLPPAGSHQAEASVSTLRRDGSPAKITRSVTFDADVPHPQPYPQPTPDAFPTSTSHSSLNMTGPFPSPTRHPLMRHSDTLSMYSLGPTDFFTMSSGPATSRASRDGELTSRSRDGNGTRSAVRRSSPGSRDARGLASGILKEEDEK